MAEFKMFDDRKPTPDDTDTTKKKIKFGHARKLIDYSEQKKTRPEKIEEIKQVWQSPIFKNNNARLMYLFHHCKSPEHGYTIREFAWAKFPDKMEEDSDPTPGFPTEGEYHAFKAIHQMFNRFRKQELKREILLAGMYKRFEGEKFGRWYYWNIIDDEQAIKDLKLFTSLCLLGGERRMRELQDIVEHPEDVQAEIDKTLSGNNEEGWT